MSKLYDLAVKTSTYSDRSGKEKANWENIGVVLEGKNGPYILLNTWVNLSGLPRDDKQSGVIVYMFKPKEKQQDRTFSNFNAQVQPDYFNSEDDSSLPPF